MDCHIKDAEGVSLLQVEGAAQTSKKAAKQWTSVAALQALTSRGL